MADRSGSHDPSNPWGCLVTGIGATVLALLSPFVLGLRSWRAWRRGPIPRSTIATTAVTNPSGAELSRIDVASDVPHPAEAAFLGSLTDAVVRIAESLRVTDDVYHLAYRLPWEEEPVVLPVGPQLQELGERFSLVQTQGKMAGRTVVWLTLGRERALAEVLSPDSYDPEADGEPDALMIHPDVRWAAATEWIRGDPSLKFRMILMVPTEAVDRVKPLLASLS